MVAHSSPYSLSVVFSSFLDVKIRLGKSDMYWTTVLTG